MNPAAPTSNLPQHGPHPWMICDRCNYVTHRCHFCGDDLSHNQGLLGACPGCLEDHLEEGERELPA